VFDRRVRLGIVGTGAISHAYAEAVKGLESVDLVSACDTDAAAARRFEAVAGCSTHSSLRAMLAGERLDAVVVCTPPATHEAMASEALECGTHVLCEKPLAIDVESADRMAIRAIRNNVLLTMASKFRFVDDVRAARDLAAGGIIGEVVLIENAFTSSVNMSRRWNSDPAISGGGVLIDNGTHAVDILRFFLGQLRDVKVFEGKRLQTPRVEDTVRLFARNESGVIGTSDLSWSINKELDTFLRIYGTEGTILVGWKESKYRLRSSSEWTVFGTGYDKVDAFRKQLANFTDAIRGEADLAVTMADAVASIEVIAAAYEALRTSRWKNVSSLVEASLRTAPTRMLEAV
jgi:predicted dehydrogenase